MCLHLKGTFQENRDKVEICEVNYNGVSSCIFLVDPPLDPPLHVRAESVSETIITLDWEESIPDQVIGYEIEINKSLKVYTVDSYTR